MMPMELEESNTSSLLSVIFGVSSIILAGAFLQTTNCITNPFGDVLTLVKEAEGCA